MNADLEAKLVQIKRKTLQDALTLLIDHGRMLDDLTNILASTTHDDFGLLMVHTYLRASIARLEVHIQKM
jgi:hypothetical protein